MSLTRITNILLILSTLIGVVAAQSVDATLARMTELSKGFRSATADVEKISYTFVIKDESKESGKMTVYRPNPRDTRMKFEFNAPEEHAVAYANSKLEIYYPKRAERERYDLGKQSRLIEEYLLLGIGSSGADLRKAYYIKYLDTTDEGGAKADHLELVPKAGEAREQVSKIELWVAQPGGYPVRMKVLQPSRDFNEVRYTSVHINPSSISEDSVRLKVPPGVKTVTPQK